MDTHTTPDRFDRPVWVQIMGKEEAAFEEFHREYYQLSVRATPAQSRARSL